MLSFTDPNLFLSLIHLTMFFVHFKKVQLVTEKKTEHFGTGEKTFRRGS